MEIIACIISLVFMIISFVLDRKNKSISPNVLFFALWSFILLLSILNLYNIIKPSNEAYLLILLMLIFYFIGNLLNKLTKKDYIKLSFKKSKKENLKELKPRFKLFYVLSFFIILFNIIDFVIIIKQLLNGNPMWQIRNWTLEAFGSSNPILDRRSFIEEVFRSIILSPFSSIIPPIAAYMFFNSKDKKQRYSLLIVSLVVLISSSLAGGGGRLGFIYYFGCFLLAFFIIYKNKEKNQEEINKYKKIVIIFAILGIVFLIAFTIFRTGIRNLFKQVYTYFALPPTLLSIWLPKLKEVAHTYGMTTFFGVHSYFFRVFDTIGLDFLVPQIYNETYKHIVNAEVFRNVGYGVANAFVTPIYYFFIDGGYPFVCCASLFFGYVVSKLYRKFEQNINLRTFTIYSLIMYAVFVTFIRIQVAIPAYLISFVFAFFILRSSKEIKQEEVAYIQNYENKINRIDLISVIIPVYNVEKYINKCIDSVINQTYTNLEIILIDDGSPDKCGEICEQYAKKDKRIKVIHKENGGLSDARNYGIDISKGKYITFIDSDDYIEKNYIEMLYNSIIENKTDIAIGSHKVIYENGTIINKATNEEIILDSKEVLERMLYDEGIDLSAWAKLYKKELFKEIKYPKGRLYEDAATTYKLIDKSNKISMNSKPIYNYMIRNNSITSNTFSAKKMDLIISTEEMTSYVKNKYPDLEKAANRRLIYAYLSTLSQLAMTKEQFPEEQKKMICYIKQNRLEALKDRRLPVRDKIALLFTIFGFRIFKIVWNIYVKITGRK